jgi:predicted DNA-binding transcriptional regulator AlpA
VDSHLIIRMSSTRVAGKRLFGLVIGLIAAFHHGVWVGQNGLVTAEPDPDVEWWTTSDVVAYLGVKVATVTNYRKRGQMPPPAQTIGRTHVWRPARIIEWHAGRPRPGIGGRPPATRDEDRAG